MKRPRHPITADASLDAADRDVWAVPAREAARTTAAVVQDGAGELDLTVGEYVATGRVPHSRLFAPDDPAPVANALAAAGVAEFAHRHVGTLSGGERQRVHLARALAQQPQILVLDEPTNHLGVHATCLTNPLTGRPALAYAGERSPPRP